MDSTEARAVTRKAPALLAWGLLAVYLAGLLVAFAAAAMAGRVGREFLTPEDLPLLVVFTAFPITGAMIASRRPDNAIGWVFCSTGVFVGLLVASSEYAYLALRSHPGLPGGVLAAWVSSWTWYPILGSVTFLLLLFPGDKLEARRWRVASMLAILALIGVCSKSALAPGPLEGDASIHNPIGIPGAGGVLEVVQSVSGVLMLVLALVGAASIILRFRRARGDERQQLKWFAYSAAVLVVLILVSIVFDREISDQVDTWLLSGGLALLPVSTAVAVLKYRLYEIDVVIRKTVLYGVLAAFFTSVYVAVVVGIGALVGSRSNQVLTIAAAVLVAVAFNPVRQRARHFANRVVYGRRATPYEVLSDFSERMAGTAATEDALPRMARMLAEATGATRAEVLLRVGDELRPAGHWPADAEPSSPAAIHGDGLPDLRGATLATPVLHQGSLLGALTVSKPESDPLTPTEEKLVADLAAQAGLLLRNVRLTEELRANLAELRASRQRIVAAQDQERRRLERNIHDGAQQQLVALSVKLGLARTLAGRDAEGTGALLERLQAETQQALEDLRDLARGIYPPLLADRGLVAALRAQARKAAVPVAVEAEGVGRYAQEAEAAVYFCVLEALQNVAKYAGATATTVRLAATNGNLTFVVADDGAGFDPTTTRMGTGLQGMADRLEALGGGLAVESEKGTGTTVTGRIPVAGVEVRPGL